MWKILLNRYKGNKENNICRQKQLLQSLLSWTKITNELFNWTKPTVIKFFASVHYQCYIGYEQILHEIVYIVAYT